MNLIKIDLNKKYLGRSPIIRDLVWPDHNDKKNRKLGTRNFGVTPLMVNDKKVKFDKHLDLSIFDPYKFYAIQTKLEEKYSKWRIIVIDNNELYMVSYFDIMEHHMMKFKMFYDKVLKKEMKAFEVLTYFCL